MSVVDSSTPSRETSAPQTPAFFRFSLLTLLSVTTLAGFVSAIVFSKHWHADERLLLAFWCAGLILGASVGKWQGTSGVLSTGIGAAVGCLLAATLVMCGLAQPDRQPGSSGHQMGSLYLAFVITAGYLAALLLAGSYYCASRWSEQLWSNRITRTRLLAGLAVLLVVFFVFQSLRPRHWQPTWEIELRAHWPADYPLSHLSPRGDFLFTRQSMPISTGGKNQRFQFTPRGVVRETLPPHSVGIESQPSPDGELIVDHFLSDAWLIDRRSNESTHSWRFEHHITQMQFSVTSDRLLVTTDTPRIQRLYDIDLANSSGKRVTQEKLPQPELFPFAGRLLVDPTGEVLVKLFDPTDETGERTAEIVRRSDGQLLGRMTRIPACSLKSIAPLGEYVAFNDRVWKRDDDTAQAMPGTVVGFTANRRAIVHCEPRNAPRVQLPGEFETLPLVRHWFDRDTSAHFEIIDLKTGVTLTKSAAFPRMSHGVSSLDGSVVLGQTFPDAYIRVWKVPKR